VACGTLSSVALPRLRQLPPFPLFEAISPAVEAAAKLSKKHVTVLATVASIRSGVYERALHDRGVEKVEQLACPLFVPVLEEGCKGDGEVARAVVRHTLSKVNNPPSAAVLLGCTHYGFLSPAIKSVWPNVSLVDSGTLLAHRAWTDLPLEEGQGRTLFYTTGAPNTFLKKASALLSVSHLTVYGTLGR
jgi:glutamate racemase